ncbi:hypothetical protein BVG16_12740 [Paenibacillus selenitireducens]|uniref:Uncharacterized protein n=1 Tax=Paenibacillus selenitireducens TaxID=1324314 RepID=A0A1T2XGG0_9BACL|nr:hypothetical protein [Paenibacillus selenitireducens]OPA78713.1 hypothetical protein BVG16_12740 [Paenibacillus selenitireducens]
MRSNVFKVTISLIIVLGIIITLILFFYQFPKKVDIVSPAVSFYEKDPSSIKHTSIRISGTLNRPLFQQHIFKGTVTIDGLEFTKENGTLDTYVLDKNNGINSGNLVYHKPSKPGEIVTLSMIWFDDNFEHINIVSKWGPNKKLWFFIVSGSSYEEVIDTQKKMREKYGSTFVPRE